MKKVVNGKMYDTETATEICGYANGANYRDFNYHSSDLFRKKNGEYFIRETTYDADFIYLVTESEAKKFAEKHLDGDQYVEIFGDVEE